MPRLADETLVAAHETTLERWKETNPEQHDQLAEPVREVPIYEPLRPSPAEEEFYVDRARVLQSLPRYRIRKINREDRPTDIQSSIALVEDTRRMAVYRGRITEILRGDVDWPDDVVEFARDQLPHELYHSRSKAASKDNASGEASTPSITGVLPEQVIRDTADSTGVGELALLCALDDLQATAADHLDRLAREYRIEQYAGDHVVILAAREVVENALAGYGDDVREAAEIVHRQGYSPVCWTPNVPLHVACTPADVSQISRVDNRGRERDAN